MNIDRQIEILEHINSLIKIDDFFRRGICDILYHLSLADVINEFEYYFMLKLLNKHKPTPENDYKEFTENPYWSESNNYWWDTMHNPETRQIRKDYLTKLVTNLK